MCSQRILSASPGTKIQILGSCLRVSLPASLCSLSGFYPLRPLQTESLIRRVFAGVSACIVMCSQRILSASPGTKIQILGSCLRVSLPASLCPFSGFYPLRPLQTESLIGLVFAGVSACIVMCSQRILSASPGTKIQILGSCLRVSLPASLCPLSGFYPLRLLHTESLIRRVFAGVSACIAMSIQRILSASPVTNRIINWARVCGCFRLHRDVLSADFIRFARYKDSDFRLVFAVVSACIAMSIQRILSASPVTNRIINWARVCGCFRLHRDVLSADFIRFARYKDSNFRLVFAGVSACIAMSTQRILSASPVTYRIIN